MQKQCRKLLQMNSFTFLFEAMNETHEQIKTKIDIDEFRSGTTNITLFGLRAKAAEESLNFYILLLKIRGNMTFQDFT
jgi:hypothetical protein